MQQLSFIAKCPFEIGDMFITKHANMGKSEQLLNIMDEAKEVTDIMTLHSLKDGKVVFYYEFDNSGIYNDLMGNEMLIRRKVAAVQNTGSK